MLEPFRVANAREVGISESRLRSREFGAPFHGVRSSHGVESDVDALCRAYAVKMRRDAAFAKVTAAQLLDVPLPVRFSPSPVHVSVPTGTAPVRGRGIAGHHHGPWVTVEPVRGLRVFSPASTWASLGGMLSVPDLVAVADALVTATRTVPARCSVADLQAVLRLARLVGAADLRAALGFVLPGPASRPESLLRVLLVAAGIPVPAVNFRIADLGLIIDLAWPELRFGLEYDGGYHRSPAQFGADIRRHERIHDREWLLMRVTKEDLFDAPLELVARVRTRLAGRGLVTPSLSLPQSMLPRR